MATTKSAGSTRLGRDSASQRLGVKLFDGQLAQPGNVLIRQRGTKFLAGKNVKIGKDDTLYSMASGKVEFSNKRITNFNGKTRQAKVVNVLTA